MDKQKIIAHIREYLAEQFGITPAFVADDAIIDNLMLDCLDRCELCMELEEEYTVRISDEDCFEAKTISELADIVVGKMKKRSAK